MSEIPLVDDQFVEEADEALVPRYTPSRDKRMCMFVSFDANLDELRLALAAGGFAVTAHPEGWCVDKVHAIALVQAANEGDPA